MPWSVIQMLTLKTLLALLLSATPCQLPQVTVCGPHLEEHRVPCPNGGSKLVRVLVDADFRLIDGCPTLVRERLVPVKDLSRCP